MLNLDTHMLVHALDGTLTRVERGLLSTNTWGIPAGQTRSCWSTNRKWA